jgi:hypothetical protein
MHILVSTGDQHDFENGMIVMARWGGQGSHDTVSVQLTYCTTKIIQYLYKLALSGILSSYKVSAS